MLLAGALIVAPMIAAAQTPMGDAPFCLKSASGSVSCIFQTMAACQQAKLAGSTDECVDKAGATSGAGGAMPPPAGPPSPSPSPSPSR
jgi:hypothetical protein